MLVKDGNVPDRTVSHADWCENPIEFPAKQVYSPASSIVIFVRYRTSTSDMFKLPVWKGKPNASENAAFKLYSHVNTNWQTGRFSTKVFQTIPWRPWRKGCHQVRTGCRSSRCASATECAAAHHCRPYNGTGHPLRPRLLCWLVDRLVKWVCEESVLK